jgi:O-antigen/teichoic acid export membrane protein
MSFIQRVVRLVSGGDFFRGALLIVVGTGAAQLINVLSQPIVTRLYTPSDFGVLSVATSILSVLVSITCLRYEFAIPLPADNVEAANLVGLSLIVNAGMALLTVLAVLLFGDWILGLFHAEVLGPYILLFALAQFGGGVTSTFINWAVRAKDYSGIAVNQLYQSITLVAVQIGLGIVRFGAPGLVLGAVAGNIAGSSRLARASYRAEPAAFRKISVEGMRTVASRYRRFPIYSSGSALLGSIGLRAPLLLLVGFYGTEVGGQYALAERLLYLPLTLVAGGVGHVFIAQAARLAREEGDALRKLFIRTTAILAGLALGPSILIAILSPILFAPIFGTQWDESGRFVATLVPMFYLAFVVTSTGDILYILERQRLHLVREILRLSGLGGSVLIAALLHLSPSTSIVVLSVGGCITYVLYGVISWRAITEHRPRPEWLAATDPDKQTEAEVATEVHEVGW